MANAELDWMETLEVVDAFVDYHAFYAGNPQALSEHLRKQRGGKSIGIHLQRVSEGEDRLRRMQQGERIGPKDPNPLVSQLTAKGRQRAQVIAVMPVDESLKTLEEFFGEAHPVEPLPDMMKGDQLPARTPVLPRNEMIARLTQELRRERR